MRYLSVICLLMALVCSFASAQEISGPISGTYGPGIYLVVGDLSVLEGDSLILLPGAVFLFQGANNYSFDIDGYLSSVGTEVDSIKFMPDVAGSTWTGVDFNSTSDPGCRLEYCLVTGSTQSGVDCFGSNPWIVHCSILYNDAGFGGGIYATSGAAPTIMNCLIRGNSTQVCGAGIWASSSNPVISDCIVTENNAGNSSGGIYCYSADAVITNCIITWNTSYAGAGGVFCRNVSPELYNCIITDNTTQTVGGGINMNNTAAIVDHCVIARNSAGISGGGIEAYISTPAITNCTISGNHCEELGGGIESFDSTPEIRNTIIEGNTGFGGIYFFNSMSATVEFCDIFDNEGGNFAGTLPTGFGVVNTTNANGDSCDQFCNIQFDPVFYATSGDSAYYLTIASPCIDGGDPNSPFDPDNTVADIGMYFFDQASSPSPIAVTLTPYNPPIQIPATGGSFNFNICVRNCDPTVQTFDCWTMVTLPDGSPFGPVLGPVNLTLPVSAIIDRDRTQNVPESAPVGIYTYEAYVGVYPDDVWDDDSFEFEKLDEWVGIPVDDWLNRGESLDSPDGSKQAGVPEDHTLLTCFPNPFNSETSIRYQIQQAGSVQLDVCDLSGRRVVMLSQDWREVGLHQISWQPGAIASGVYLVNLIQGGQQFTTKVLYIK